MSKFNVNNESKSYAQKHYEHNLNYTRTADYRTKLSYQQQLKESTGGKNSHFNFLLAGFNIQNRPLMTSPNANFLGVRSSHFVPQQGRRVWDLENRMDSSQRNPDTSVIFTKSQVPHSFSG